MEPVHIVTDKKNIAPLVLFPGDPLRAKYIAEKFLTNIKLVNKIRNMYAFTGYYKDKLVTVVGSGMGCPSASLYAYELFTFYGVEKIIRIGSAGANKENIKLMDTVLSTGAYSESSIAYQWGGYTDKFIESNNELNEIIKETAKEQNIDIHVGPTLTSDVFDVYASIDHVINTCPIKDELLATEMEGFGIFHVARICKKQASMLITIVDSKFDTRVVSPEMRETHLDNMIILALESIIK
jgi:purine-nucleoside phosphorylase